MDLNLDRIRRLADIVMDVYLHDPIFNGLGYIIGEGANEINVRDFVQQVLDVGRRKMGLTQKELANLIGSYPSNWNEWFRQQGRPLHTEGQSTIWLFNEIILLHSQNTVKKGPPPPQWPLRN